MGEERRRRQAANGGGVRHDRRGGRRVDIVGGGRREPRQVGTVRRLAHVRVRSRRLAVMRLQRRQCLRLRHRIMRLHGVLRHGHTGDGGGGQRRGALGQAGGGRSRRVRTRVHDFLLLFFTKIQIKKKEKREEKEETKVVRVVLRIDRAEVRGSCSRYRDH